MHTQLLSSSCWCGLERWQAACLEIRSSLCWPDVLPLLQLTALLVPQSVVMAPLGQVTFLTVLFIK